MATKTSQQIEQEFVESLLTTTGKDLTAWLKIIKESSIEKRNDIIDWLKTGNGFGHSNASMLAGIYLNNGKPVYADDSKLIDDQFKGKETMRPLYETLKTEIAAIDSSYSFVATKMYTSVRDGKEFAVIAVKKDELKVAMDLGDEPIGDYFQQAKNLGSMPRISHMVSVKSAEDISMQLKDFLVKAHARVYKK